MTTMTCIAAMPLALVLAISPPPLPVPSAFMGEGEDRGVRLFLMLSLEPGESPEVPRVRVTLPRAGALNQLAEGVRIEEGAIRFAMAPGPGVDARFTLLPEEGGGAAAELAISLGGERWVVPMRLRRTEAPATVPGVRAWQGGLQAGPGRPLVMRIVLAESELFGPVGSIDIPAQGVSAFPLLVDRPAADSWRLRMPAGVDAIMELAEIDGGEFLQGRFRQGPADLPLELARDASFKPESTGLRRPQHPTPPFPYELREVAIAHPQGHRLAGTLTLPPGTSAEAPVAAAVLVTGSGPQDRDETLLGHKPFLVIADALTRSGIAVLRYDDRGCFGSTGDFGSASTLDFSSDAAEAVRFLRTLPEIDGARVGIIGHSEGGIVAPIAAAELASEGSPLAFVVSLAGPGVPGHEILRVQMRAILQAAEIPADSIEAISAAQARLLDLVLADAAAEAIEQAAIALLEAQARTSGMFGDAAGDSAAETREAMRDAAIRTAAEMRGPWMRTFLKLDPAEPLAALAVPTLVLLGELDRQVDLAQNRGAIEAALARSSAPHEIRVLAGLNHLLQPARTGGLDEYGEIEVTFDPAALAGLVEWVLSTTRAR
jgi:fermentation-respiration switch protein FrsA (DUF1100 family)